MPKHAMRDMSLRLQKIANSGQHFTVKSEELTSPNIDMSLGKHTSDIYPTP